MAEEARLKRATEWKVFEAQASLLAEDVSPEHLAVAKKWIQPVHYAEMIEERNGSRKCGFPLCQRGLKASPSTFRELMDSKEEMKEDGNAISSSRSYCSNACCQKSADYYSALDVSAPMTRSHAAALVADLSDENKDTNVAAIDDILDTLSVSEIDNSRCSGEESPLASSDTPIVKGNAKQQSNEVPMLNISRYRPDGSPIKRTAEPKSTSSSSNAMPLDKPITLIKASKIPSQISESKPTQHHKVADGVSAPLSSDSTLKSISVLQMRPEEQQQSLVPHTDTDNSISESSNSRTNNASKSRTNSLILPASLQPLWDSSSTSPSTQTSTSASALLNSNTVSDSAVNSIYHTSSLLHTLAVPSLLSYDPVTSSLPPEHTPLASARGDDNTSQRKINVPSVDHRQMLEQLTSQSQDEVFQGTHRGYNVTDFRNKSAVAKEKSHSSESHIPKEAVGQFLKPTPLSRRESNREVAAEPTVGSSDVLKVSHRGNIRQSNPEALKSILKVAKSEISEGNEDLLLSLESRVSDLQVSPKKLDKAKTRQNYLNSSKSEFGIYDLHSDEEDGEYDLDSDEEQILQAKRKKKHASIRSDENIGKPKFRLKTKTSPKKKKGSNENAKSVSFGENSTRIIDNKHNVSESGVNGGPLKKGLEPQKKKDIHDKGEQRDRISKLDAVKESNKAPPVRNSDKMVMHPIEYRSNSIEKNSESPMLPTHECDADNNSVLMKHAVDLPSVSDLEQKLTAEEVEKLLVDEDDDMEMDKSFDDELYGERVKEVPSSLNRLDKKELAKLLPQERDQYLINKYRYEEETLYGRKIDPHSGDVTIENNENNECKVQTPLFSEQLEEWLGDCEWGKPVKETDAIGLINERGFDKTGRLMSRKPKVSKMFNSSYKDSQNLKGSLKDSAANKSISENTVDWDFRMAEIDRQNAEKLAATELEASARENDIAEAAAKKLTQKQDQARLFEADPALRKLHEERKEQRRKLKRDQKIKALPPHMSPSAALRQAAMLRRENAKPVVKVRPPHPRPRPTAVPMTSQDNLSQNWHPPPPPNIKKKIVPPEPKSVTQKKRTNANEIIMKMKVTERKPENVATGIFVNESIGGGGAFGDIEGYRPLYGDKLQDNGSENTQSEKIEVPVMLSEQDIEDENIVVLSPQEDLQSDIGMTEDEKIWKEIFGADAKLPGSDDEDEDAIQDIKAEMNTILSENYFIYMWTTLEDLFNNEVIAWMNGGQILHENRSALTSSPHLEISEQRQLLSTSSQNVAHSLATLLHRSIQQAEKSLQFNSMFESDEPTSACLSTPRLFSISEGREYHQAKQKLLSKADIRRANPSFNSTQWQFLGLILVDALVIRKVLQQTGENTPCFSQTKPEISSTCTSALKNAERAVIWNYHFSCSLISVMGGESTLNSLLEPRELQNLRSFFYIDI